MHPARETAANRLQSPDSGASFRCPPLRRGSGDALWGPALLFSASTVSSDKSVRRAREKTNVCYAPDFFVSTSAGLTRPGLSPERLPALPFREQASRSKFVPLGSTKIVREDHHENRIDRRRGGRAAARRHGWPRRKQRAGPPRHPRRLSRACGAIREGGRAQSADGLL